MKKPKIISTLVIIAFFFSILRPDLIWAQGETPAGQPQKVFLAVMELDLSAGVPAEARTSLSDILREQLWKTGRFRVVDRNNMERIMKEQGFQLSDCTSKECAVKVGQLLGVEEMVTGNVTLLGKTYIISVQMTRVETGEIEKMASDRCPACELDQLIGSIDKVSAALAEAIGGVVAPPKQVSTKPAAAGSLNVYSDPSGAEVYWDGARVGVSAIFLKDLKQGEHRLLLKKEGYAPQELAVSVKPGLNTVQVQLRQLATVVIQGAPDGAQILMDGKAMGTAPREVMVPAGTHRVELSLTGYKGYSQDFEAQEGESRSIGYTLQPALAKPVIGSLEVNSEPAEAEVYLDGSRAGMSPTMLKDIKPGNHRLLLKKEGYAPQEMAVSVKPGLNSVEARLKQLATIMVQGAPDGAQILMDGKAMGTAPREVMVPAGTHRVELSLAGYKGYSQDFEAREGESRTIGYSLESVEKPREAVKIIKPKPKPKPKGKGGVAKGFYYTGLSLTVLGSVGLAGLMQDRGIRRDHGGKASRVSTTAYTFIGVSGAGFLTGTLSYIFMPSLSGRERAHLAGYSGIDIAATGLALAGLSTLGAQEARSKYEDENDQNFLDMNKGLVESWNTFVYVSYGIIGAGVLTAIISFAAAPKAKVPDRTEEKSFVPKVAISPEMMAYPEGGGYIGAKFNF